MEAPSIDLVYQAITALYDNPNNEEKEKASIWLAGVQKSIHSWNIADELLQRKKDINSCYFAAQTLRSKVQHNLSELPLEAVVSLRDSLITHIEGITPTSNASILTQLNLAIADLALQTPSWENCIGDLITSFSNKNNLALIEILTELPLEIDSKALKLGENRRVDVKQQLRQYSQNLSLFLKQCLENSQSTDLALKCIKCMASWIQVEVINIQDIAQNDVVGLSIQVLRNRSEVTSLHNAATDCICTLLQKLEANTEDSIDRLLYDNVASMEQSYHMAVAKEDEQQVLNYTRLFTELALSYLMKMLSSASRGERHFAMGSLDLVLISVGHHDYEVAENTFNFWYRLSEELFRLDKQPLTDVFKPYIERLLMALVRHCQCETDMQKLPDETDDFYDFRMKAEELIKDVVFIVGSSYVFRQMFSALTAHSDASWEQTEAALFVMQAVAKNIVTDEYEYVPKVIEAILSMPDSTHLAVRRTCIQLLGELCEWIEQHPQCLEACLDSLTRALSESYLAHTAATAIQNISSACRNHMSPLTPKLVDALSLLQEKIQPKASDALARGVAAAIGRMPDNQMSSALSIALAPSIIGLRTSGQRPPTVWLDRIASLCRDVDAPNQTRSTLAPAFNDLLHEVQNVMLTYRSDGHTMERACRCLRFAFRCAGRGNAPYLPQLANNTANIYAENSHSCLLYLSGILVDELWMEADCVPHLISLLNAMMPKALQLLSNENGVKEHPDTVDDMFRLCIRFLQRIPLDFVASGAMPAIMQCCMMASALDHRDGNASVMNFMFEFTSAAIYNGNNDKKIKVRDLVSQILNTYGADLTYALISASVFSLHPYMLSDVGEVLINLVIWQRKCHLDWVRPALCKLPRESAAATEQQCVQFHQYLVNTDNPKEMGRLLKDFAKLYR